MKKEFVFIFLLSNGIYAQSCNDLLANGVADVFDASSTTVHSERLMDWFCDSRFNSEEEANSFGAGLSLPFEGLPVALGFDSNTSSWSSWYRNTCASRESQAFDFSQVNIHTETISSNVLDAFNRCIATDGLHIWLERGSGPSVAIAAKFNDPGNLGPQTIEELDFTRNVICGSEWNNEQITGATTRNLCIRQNDKEVRIVITKSSIDPIGGNLYLPEIWMPEDVGQNLRFTARYLSDITPKRISRGFNGGIQFNRVSWAPNTVRVGGSTYSKAISMVPLPDTTVFVEYEVPTGAVWFRSQIGMACQESNEGARGDFSYSIYIDDSLQRNSRIYSSCADAPEYVEERVNQGDILKLEIDSNGTNNADHATWVNARFE